eukprot:TRINITY_DN587_c0_g1_i1.p1 TRINITY_DN587_c0_g1~~TRINITY_DN587_c0_g1_i1.p1  ORF type:complete len:545 (-),score=94.65 TRINITY_DN587_c0_g1_i1:191-1780(-)
MAMQSSQPGMRHLGLPDSGYRSTPPSGGKPQAPSYYSYDGQRYTSVYDEPTSSAYTPLSQLRPFDDYQMLDGASGLGGGHVLLPERGSMQQSQYHYSQQPLSMHSHASKHLPSDYFLDLPLSSSNLSSAGTYAGGGPGGYMSSIGAASLRSYMDIHPPSSSGYGIPPPGKRSLEQSDLAGQGKRHKGESAAIAAGLPQRPGVKECAFFMRTGSCSYGAECRFNHPVWVDVGGIPDWKEEDVIYPERPGEEECLFYMRYGTCKFGPSCRYHHPRDHTPTESGKTWIAGAGREGEHHNNAQGEGAAAAAAAKGDDAAAKAAKTPEVSMNSKGYPLRPDCDSCTFYVKTGSCKFGDTCKFNHPEKIENPGEGTAPAPAKADSMSIFQDFPFPERPGQKECAFYMKTGDCKYGNTCRWHHPRDRAAAATADHSAGRAAIASRSASRTMFNAHPPYIPLSSGIHYMERSQLPPPVTLFSQPWLPAPQQLHPQVSAPVPPGVQLSLAGLPRRKLDDSERADMHLLHEDRHMQVRR